MVIGLMLLLRQRFFALIVEMMIIQYEIWGPNPPMLTVDNESDGDILAFYICKISALIRMILLEWDPLISNLVFGIICILNY